MSTPDITQLPQDFLERVRLVVPQEKIESVLHSFCVRRPTTFRVNTLKSSRQEVIDLLSKLDFEIEAVSWYEDAFILKNPSKKELLETDIYKDGKIYVQSLSSMIPPLVLNPQPGENICDLTAAPGSKTTQMAAMMHNAGEIFANDKSRIRMYKLEANLKQQGVSNVKTAYFPGQMIWKRYPEHFDKTLVDVPCSLEGRISVLDEKTYSDWSTNKVKELVQVQRFLLRSAISATKVGGEIVYSTCTLSPEENEGVVDWILKKEKDALEVEEITLNIDGYGGIKQWGNKTYDPRVAKSLRIFPSEIMEGFYVVLLKKLKPTVPLDHLINR